MTTCIVTVGSSRQGTMLTRALPGSKVVHVAEATLEHGVRSVADIARHLRDAVGSDACDVVGISLGRGKYPGGIAAAALAWLDLAAGGAAGLRRMVWLGPSPVAAEVFEDKLLAMAALAHAGITTVPYSERSPHELAAPLVVKARRLTGGAGIEFAANGADAVRRAERLRRNGQRPVFTSFRHGLEISVEALVICGRVFPLANVFKEACDHELTHADWKIKLAVPVSWYPPAGHLLDAFTAAFPDVSGYLSIEGIVDPGGRIDVMEVATRRTGNYALSNAVFGAGGSERLISDFMRTRTIEHVQTGAPGPCAIGLAVPCRLAPGQEPDVPRDGLLEATLDRVLRFPPVSPQAPERLRLGYRTNSHGAAEIETVARVLGGRALPERHDRFVRDLAALGVLTAR